MPADSTTGGPVSSRTGSTDVPTVDPTTTNDGTSEIPVSEKKSKLRTTYKKEITIMLIGETGAGKTAFMSLLINLFMGNGPYELEERHNAQRESGADKSQSQTNDATMYAVSSMDGTTIRILDTPGLADTRGIDQDEKHKAKINQAIQKEIKTLDAVIIMANGTVQRLGAATEYTLSVIASLFPHTIIDNIGFIFTHTDPLTFNFQKDSLQPELKDAQHWLIQNPLAYYQSYKRLKASNASERILSRGRRDLEQFYDDTVEELDKWIEWLDTRRVQPSKEINDLYQMSNGIEANIERALTAITRMHDERVAWEGIQEDLKNTEKRKEALEKLKDQETAPFWDRPKTDRHNTLCIVPGCHGNCHIECGLVFLLDVEALGKGCDAFAGNRNKEDPKQSVCKRAGCGHKAESHRHYNDKWEFRNKEMSQETKDALEQAESKEGSLKQAEELAKKKLEDIESEMKRAQNEIRTLVDKYNAMALSKNFAGHIQSAIKMLEFRKKELEAKPNTKQEVDMIKDAIAKFEEKLAILGQQDSKSKKGIWDRIKGVWRSS
ncbi:unnamed protein product [Rhizoctonia solani]|uniref:AIG1-type G domain-containing protein n=1 Tax=Rhizoctonia solani TaxID=456999 RepID=A0A8H3AZ06_9AGAM|nr:unnamed protein product [Rhizoctonia solani]